MGSQGLPWHVVHGGCSSELPAAGTVGERHDFGPRLARG